LLALACVGVSQAADPSKSLPAYIRSAVDDRTRPDSDRQRDENRKPADVLAFSGIKPGDRVAELVPYGGYYTRLLCRVVGPKGRLFAVNLKFNRPMNEPPPAPGPDPCGNVTTISRTARALDLPADLDAVWLTENYHDLFDDYWFGGKPALQAFNGAVLNALKPGGVFIVEDHAAQDGSGTRDTDTLHRIDPSFVKEQVTAVGFFYVGESTALHHSEDPHTATVFQMHDKSDRFLFKFMKPRQ
jgi:predicted methyltransferase